MAHQSAGSAVAHTSSRASSSTVGIGDIIAQGFQAFILHSTTANQPSYASSATLHNSSMITKLLPPISTVDYPYTTAVPDASEPRTGNQSQLSPSPHARTSGDVQRGAPVNITSPVYAHSSLSVLHGSQANRSVSAIASNLSGNASYDLNACWKQWTSFWAANPNAIKTSYPITSTWTSYTIYPAFSAYTLTETDPGTTFTADAFSDGGGGFVFTITVTISRDGETFTTTQSAEPATTVSNPEYSIIFGPLSTSNTLQNYTITTPICDLPSIVPQCQSEWASFEALELLATAIPQPSCAFEDYFSASCSLARSSASSASSSFSNAVRIQRPLCSQATIGSSLCDQLRDLYIEDWIEDWIENDGKGPLAAIPLSSAGYQLSWSSDPDWGPEVLSTYFPTSSKLAPGCTIGCARCAITGGAVRLLYWPTTATAAMSDSDAEQSKVTEGPVTAVVSGTTLTSPTNYISYASLYAQDSCSAVGRGHDATILAIPTTVQLSSLYVTWPDLMPHTASFNFTDLNLPVPESIYSRQLRCTGYYPHKWIDQEPLESQATRTCPTTLGPYAPIRKSTQDFATESMRSRVFNLLTNCLVVVPSQILQSVDPAWSTCSGDIRYVEL